MTDIKNKGKRIVIVGAGLSGLSAAVTLAEAGIGCDLISSQQSERAQSVLAEGGINAALDTMGEGDCTENHFNDTMKGGVYLESESAVRQLTENAPDVVRKLVKLGVPFNSKDGSLVLRNFGGQKKKRTAYAKSSTGKMIMTALIDETRKYEAEGLITRYPHHDLVRIETSPGTGPEDSTIRSITVRDSFGGGLIEFAGPCILCTGGLNGIFEGYTTGTTQNTGNAAALAFDAGVKFADLEFIQFHPTTVAISNKVMLISEAARGEGGRLWIKRGGEKWYFMEEKYPELGNLMPRDVVSREMVFAAADPGTEGGVYLDMTELDGEVWKSRLSDLREEIISYLKTDPAKDPVPVTPGIHFFMGGIRVDDAHRTSVKGLYAAGEAACKYHGANRLGGNSMLAAVYGGSVAAKTAATDREAIASGTHADILPSSINSLQAAGNAPAPDDSEISSPAAKRELREVLYRNLGIVRRPEEMETAASKLEAIIAELPGGSIDRKRAVLGLAMVKSAIARKESRGSHLRTDYPETSDEYRKLTMASYDRETGEINIGFVTAGEEFGKEQGDGI